MSCTKVVFKNEFNLIGENYIYCLCELYKGTDLLKAIIKKGSQKELKALSIVFQILEALSHMHSKKIIHRDLKPENIIFKVQNIDCFQTYKSINNLSQINPKRHPNTISTSPWWI